MKHFKTTAISAVAVTLLAAAPAFADTNSSIISIGLVNVGSLTNTTSATASTGNNLAGGSNGGNGGRGGRITADGSGSQNNDGSISGSGGNGGNANTGGAVQSGNADADAGTTNTLNANDVAIGSDCGCDGDTNSTELSIGAVNLGAIDNTTRSRARTGRNIADGSNAGNGGAGGRITADGSGSMNNDGTQAGWGGNGGTAGLGGSVLSGNARSQSGTVNLANANLLRINR